MERLIIGTRRFLFGFAALRIACRLGRSGGKALARFDATLSYPELDLPFCPELHQMAQQIECNLFFE